MKKVVFLTLACISALAPTTLLGNIGHRVYFPASSHQELFTPLPPREGQEYVKDSEGLYKLSGKDMEALNERIRIITAEGYARAAELLYPAMHEYKQKVLEARQEMDRINLQVQFIIDEYNERICKEININLNGSQAWQVYMDTRMAYDPHVWIDGSDPLDERAHHGKEASKGK